jgi:hypothetical protein
MAIRAVEHVRRLKGGAQAHLMRCDDGNYYVVKFQNNPQGVRILANEMLAAMLAQALGLPVSQPETVEVHQWLIDHTPELYIQCGNGRLRCASGFQFGSRFPCDPLTTAAYDFLPDALLETVANLQSFCGMLVFDKWTCNCDSRQSVFHRPSVTSHHYMATMVDQGFCFNANEWNFPDSPLRGLYSRPAVYSSVSGLDSFEPFLRRLEYLHDDVLEDAASHLPPEWYEGRTEDLNGLLNELSKRRTMVRQLIRDCRRAAPNSFSNWRNDA